MYQLQQVTTQWFSFFSVFEQREKRKIYEYLHEHETNVFAPPPPCFQSYAETKPRLSSHNTNRLLELLFQWDKRTILRAMLQRQTGVGERGVPLP